MNEAHGLLLRLWSRPKERCDVYRGGLRYAKYQSRGGGCRAGRHSGRGQPPASLDEGEHGRREQAPAEWLAALKGAFFQAIERAGIDAKQVRGIGVSGQQHGMVALDADGVPVYPAKLWCDTETSAQNSALVETLGGEAGCLEKLGLVLQTGYTASKVAWLREHQPDAYQRIATLLLPHDYLNFWLTGERVTEQATPRAPVTLIPAPSAGKKRCLPPLRRSSTLTVYCLGSLTPMNPLAAFAR